MKTFLFIAMFLMIAVPARANDAQVMALIQILQNTHDELENAKADHNAATRMAFHKPVPDLPLTPVPTPVQPAARPQASNEPILIIGNIRK